MLHIVPPESNENNLWLMAFTCGERRGAKKDPFEKGQKNKHYLIKRTLKNKEPAKDTVRGMEMGDCDAGLKEHGVCHEGCKR